MSNTAEIKSENKIIELATFYVGGAVCGMDILKIQEINKLMEMTQVPKAPEYVMGILNLRGQIVTIIDLARKLGLTSTQVDEKTRNIIVNSKSEHVGLLVDKISDVIPADKSKIEPPPVNLGGVQGKYFKGVFKTSKLLVGILEIEEVLKSDQ